MQCPWSYTHSMDSSLWPKLSWYACLPALRLWRWSWRDSSYLSIRKRRLRLGQRTSSNVQWSGRKLSRTEANWATATSLNSGSSSETSTTKRSRSDLFVSTWPAILCILYSGLLSVVGECYIFFVVRHRFPRGWNCQVLTIFKCSLFQWNTVCQ